VPADLALGHLEDLRNRLIGKNGILAQVVDHGIVKTQHRQVELSKGHAFVVPAITEDGIIVGITREIETARFIARDKR